jgi:hypothetical protein
MISDNDIKKLLKEGKESYTEQKLEKMIDLIKSLCHLDYEFQKRRKYDK